MNLNKFKLEQPLIKDYISTLQGQNLSPKTISTYLKTLLKFKKYLNGSLKRATQAKVEKFVTDSLNGGLASRTANRELSALRNFYNWLVYHRKIITSPVRLEMKIKITAKIIKEHLTDKDISDLQEAIAKSDNKTALRDLALIELLRSTGVRINELMNIEKNDITLAEKQLQVRFQAKGRKPRVCFFDDRTAKSLGEFLPSLPADQERLFPVSNRQFYNILNGYLREAGIKKIITAHSFRHYFATKLLENGTSEIFVQRLMGHKNLATLSIYAHPSNAVLRKAYDSATI